MPSHAVTQPDMVRRSKFKRDAPPPLRLTDDDLAIIRHVARHRFLRSTHILKLMPERSGKKLIERLGALYHNGYLDRPRAQLDYYATAGSAPLVHALGNRGALALAEVDGMDRGQIDWTWKNRSVGRLFIEHTLLIADVMVAADCATRSLPDVRLIDVRQILAAAPATTRNADNPLKLKTRAHHADKVVDLAVVPDAVFGLDFTVERKRKYFLLEADRATMPIMRADVDQTSFARKLVAYLAGGGKANTFGAHLGVGNFRVLTVTTSRERTATMIAALNQLTHGAGSQQFLFVDGDALQMSNDFLSLEWTSGKSDRVTIRD